MGKIQNLEDLLKSEDINDSIIKLDNFISGILLADMTQPQLTFYYNQELEREVNNGGFSQYFINSSGDYAHETLQSLDAIGASKTANILQQAINEFPNQIVPKNRNERTKLVQQIEETASEVWDDLDQKFYQYYDDLNDLNINYVKKNKDFF